MDSEGILYFTIITILNFPHNPKDAYCSPYSSELTLPLELEESISSSIPNEVANSLENANSLALTAAKASSYINATIWQLGPLATKNDFFVDALRVTNERIIGCTMR